MRQGLTGLMGLAIYQFKNRFTWLHNCMLHHISLTANVQSQAALWFVEC